MIKMEDGKQMEKQKDPICGGRVRGKIKGKVSGDKRR